MKKNNQIALFIFAVFSNYIFSQTSNLCIGVIPQNQTQSNVQCYGNNDAELSAYTVTANSPTITFNVTFHFIMHPTQNTSFSSMTAAQLESDVDQTISYINYLLTTSGSWQQFNAVTVPFPSALVADSKVRIQKTPGAGFYIHTDPLAIGGTQFTPWTTIFPQGYSNSMNLYFYEDALGSFAYYQPSTKYIGVSLPNENHTPGTPIRPELLCHELCHALGGLADHYYNVTAAQHFGTWNKANNISQFAYYLPDDASVDMNPNNLTSCNPNAFDAQNNFMGYTSCPKHLSARQIASFHYNVARGITSNLTANFNSAPYSYDPFNNSSETLNIATTQTISRSMIFDKMVIKAGATVTFSNCVLFAKLETSKIFVEKGAKLIMNCVKVTPRKKNDIQWQGIEVDGSSTLPQSATSYQGVLEMNNCIINKAVTGVLIGKTYYQGYNTPLSGGGWAIINNCEFSECLTGIEMLPVTNVMNPYNNLTKITDCNFYATATYLSSMGTPQFIGIKLDQVRGVEILGCSIDPNINASTWLGNLNIKKHYGIKAYNSSIVVKPSGNNSSQFQRRLDYGVHMTGYGSLVLEDSYFQTRNGVFLEGINSARVVRNYIETNKTPPLNTTSYPYDKNVGIYLSGFSNYKIEKNQIGCLSIPTNSLFCHGIVVDHSGPFGSGIYNNSIYRVRLGIWCQDQNYDPNTNVGLQINCNDFDLCEYSIGVQTQDPVTGQFTGIQKTQGISGTGDQFKVRNTYASSQYRFWNDNIPYVYPPILDHGSFVDPQFRVGPQPLYSLPGHILDIHNNENAPALKTDYCINTDANKPKVFFNAQLTEISNILTNLNTYYTTSLDGGNTSTLLAVVNSGISNGLLKNTLLSKPFLSDVILQAYFGKSSVPPGHIKQVFEANAPVTDTVYNFVMEQNLPNGIKNQITSAQNQAAMSQRSIKEAEIDITKNKLDYAITEKINALFVEDSIPNLHDSINELIVKRAEGNIIKQQIDIDIAAANYASANDKLSMLSQGDGTGSIPIHDQQYIQFKQLYISIMSSDSDRYIIKSDPAKAEALFNVANDISHPCVKEAQGLLGAVYQTYFSEEKLAPEGSGASQRESQNIEQTKVENLMDDILLYPNPAASEFFISNNSEKAYQISIYTIAGQLLQSSEIQIGAISRINTSSLTNGIYFVNLYESKTLVKTSKLVIVK